MKKQVSGKAGLPFGAAPLLDVTEHTTDAGLIFRYMHGQWMWVGVDKWRRVKNNAENLVNGVMHVLTLGLLSGVCSIRVFEKHDGKKLFPVGGLPRNELDLEKRPANTCAKLIANARDLVMWPIKRLLVSVRPKDRDVSVSDVRIHSDVVTSNDRTERQPPGEAAADTKHL